MSIKGRLKEAAGYIKEETGEKLGKPGMAQQGRDLRTEGRVQDANMPTNTPPGSGYN